MTNARRKDYSGRNGNSARALTENDGWLRKITEKESRLEVKTGGGPRFARSAATRPARLVGILAQKEVIVNADLQN